MELHIDYNGVYGLMGGAEKERCSTNSLTVLDSRTGAEYTLGISGSGRFGPDSLGISGSGILSAQALKQIKAGGDGAGLRVYDPGYTCTAAAASSISNLDATQGLLTYRGIPIQELVGQCSYHEAAYLLIYGDLPDSAQLAAFVESLSRHAFVPSTVAAVVAAMPAGSHPMACMMAGLTALGACYPSQNPAVAGMSVYGSPEVQDHQIARILGKMPTLAALTFHKLCGSLPTLPHAAMGYAENFLYMLQAQGDSSYRPAPWMVSALEALLLLHAEHGMSCCTAALRHLASSGVDVYTAMAAGVGALHGPLHGGSSEAVLDMLQAIGSTDNVPGFLQQVKACQTELAGFGATADPRCIIMRKLAEDVAAAAAGSDPLVQVALALQDAVLHDEYFVSQKLHPTVDYYSALVCMALGFPSEFNTVLLAVARVAGWCAHWKESLADPDTKIARPQQDYRGPWLRHYQPMTTRQLQQQRQQSWCVAVSTASSFFAAASSGASAAAAAQRVARSRAAAAAAAAAAGGGGGAGGCTAEQLEKWAGGSTAAAVAEGLALGGAGEECNTELSEGPVIVKKSNAYKRRIAGEKWL
ncbi:hypothetical protein OEZ85_012735 [Tetradesmus obliquus]|uniref:Citrate synthase n=1 Tax=Tetradesmus obliquus TaxID=3088 RepID=A0ABY8U3H8_TETOB|nr:hypothetical protein OEZ85_012735 [Tetradesmus obliquus]